MLEHLKRNWDEEKENLAAQFKRQAEAEVVVPITPENLTELRSRLTLTREKLTKFLLQEDKVQRNHHLWQTFLPDFGKKKVDQIYRNHNIVSAGKYGEIPIEITVGVNFMKDTIQRNLEEFCCIPYRHGIKRMKDNWTSLAAEVENQEIWLTLYTPDTSRGFSNAHFPPLAVIDHIPDIDAWGEKNNGFRSIDYFNRLDKSITAASEVTELLQNV